MNHVRTLMIGKQATLSCSIEHWQPPCGSGVCVVYQNRPTPFPGWMSQEVTKPGLSCSFRFFFSLLDRACFCVIFSVYGCMLCLVRYLFVISTSVIDSLGRFAPEMTYYVLSGPLNLTKLKLKLNTDSHCIQPVASDG